MKELTAELDRVRGEVGKMAKSVADSKVPPAGLAQAAKAAGDLTAVAREMGAAAATAAAAVQAARTREEEAAAQAKAATEAAATAVAAANTAGADAKAERATALKAAADLLESKGELVKTALVSELNGRLSGPLDDGKQTRARAEEAAALLAAQLDPRDVAVVVSHGEKYGGQAVAEAARQAFDDRPAWRQVGNYRLRVLVESDGRSTPGRCSTGRPRPSCSRWCDRRARCPTRRAGPAARPGWTQADCSRPRPGWPRRADGRCSSPTRSTRRPSRRPAGPGGGRVDEVLPHPPRTGGSPAGAGRPRQVGAVRPGRPGRAAAAAGPPGRATV